MKRIAILLALTLPACGVDGEPERPQVSTNIGVGAGSGGVHTSTGVGVSMGNMHVGVGTSSWH